MTAAVCLGAEHLRRRDGLTPAWLDPATAPPVWPFAELTPRLGETVLDFLDTHQIPLGDGDVLTGLKTWTQAVLPDLHVLARSATAARDSDDGRVTREMVIGCCRLDVEHARRHGTPEGARAFAVAVVQREGVNDRWVSAPFWSYGRRLQSVLEDRGGLTLDPQTGEHQGGWTRSSAGPLSVDQTDLHAAFVRLYTHARHSA